MLDNNAAAQKENILINLGLKLIGIAVVHPLAPGMDPPAVGTGCGTLLRDAAARGRAAAAHLHFIYFKACCSNLCDL